MEAGLRTATSMLERLRAIADRSGHTVAQLAVRWVLAQPGITSAVCGAKRPDQLRETAAAADWSIDRRDLAEIERALAERGPVARRQLF